MAKQLLGKVMMTFKDTYDSATNYEILDVVTYEGSTYVAKQETTGNVPTNEEFWAILVKRPIKGIDYFTDEEKEEFIASITNDANSIFNQNVDEKTTAFNKNASSKTTDFNTNAANKTTSFDTHVTEQTTTFDNHVSDKTTEYDTNATNKTTTFNENATQKTTDFNTNASNQTSTFNTNAENKTSDFDTNAGNQTSIFNENANAKTEVYNTNATDKLEAYNTNAQTQLNAYNTNAEELLNYAENMDNIVPKAEANGELVQVDDALDYKLLEVEVEATEVSKQDTTEGNQLVDFSNFYAVNTTNYTFENDILTVNGTKKYDQIIKNITSLLVDNSGKFLYFNFENMDTNLAKSPTIQLIIRKTDGSTSYTGLVEPTGDKKSYLIPKDVSDIKTFELSISSNNTSNELESTLIITKPMLQFGTEEKEYEKFTGGQASPNPDYPQAIETIKEVTLHVRGKNWFKNRWSSGNISSNSGDIEDVNYIVHSESYINIKTNIQYTLSRTNATSYMNFRFYDKDKNYIGNQSNISLLTNIAENVMQANVSSIALKILDERVVYMRINDASGDMNIKYQLELGDTATPYEEYKGQSISIDLQGNEIVKLSDDAKDKLLIDKKRNISLVKNTKKVILDGTEYYYFYESSVFKWRREIENIKKSATGADLLSNLFIAIKWSDGNNYLCAMTKSENGNVIAFKYDDVSTLEDFKEFLSENNVTVYYPLENPEVIPLGNLSSLIKTYKGINNIWVESNLGTTIDVVYAKDLEQEIGNINEILEVV